MRLVLAVALALAAFDAAAAAPEAPPAPPLPPHTVQGLTVSPPTEPPKLVSSFPAAGETVAPGVLVLRVTFDQRMAKTGFDIAAAPGGQAPTCLKTPRLLNDHKSFVLLCTTAPKSSYSIALNGGAHGGFVNESENRAAPATLSFSTNADDGPRDISAALKVAKLTDEDTPIAVTPDLPPAPKLASAKP